MKKEITVRIFISRNGAPEVPWESLTPEEQAQAGEILADRMAKGFEDYFRQHPEEWMG